MLNDAQSALLKADILADPVLWSQIAAGVNPEAAFYEAVKRSPAAVAECAELAV